MRMIVVIIRVNPDAVRLPVVNGRNEEMGVNNARFRMAMVIAVRMLQPRHSGAMPARA
jgi:hypothetical protein